MAEALPKSEIVLAIETVLEKEVLSVSETSSVVEALADTLSEAEML